MAYCYSMKKKLDPKATEYGPKPGSPPPPITTLATMGMSNADFGAALITEAQTRKQKANLEKSIEETQTILASLDDCEKQIAYFFAWKTIREAQLEALQAGAFSFDTQGTIVYNDDKLNRGKTIRPRMPEVVSRPNGQQ